MVQLQMLQVNLLPSETQGADDPQLGDLDTVPRPEATVPCRATVQNDDAFRVILRFLEDPQRLGN
eukprot:scaffold368_cov258-Pinguiococcus_pyrenoidosus.AAC.10